MLAVVFDFWGTLVNGGVKSPLRMTHHILAPEMPFGEFVEKYENAAMTKPYASQKEMFDAVTKVLDAAASQQDIERLIGIWNKNALLAKTFYDTIPALQELKKKVKMALISNTSSFLTEDVLDRLDLKKYFDAITLSYEEGMLKTNPEFMERVLKKLGVKKEEALMIGDSLETDMVGAEKAGIKGVLLDRRWRHPYPQRIRTLSEALSLV